MKANKIYSLVVLLSVTPFTLIASPTVVMNDSVNTKKTINVIEESNTSEQNKPVQKETKPKIEIKDPAQATQKETDTNNIIEEQNRNGNYKPPWYFWGALILAAITLFWNIFIFFYNRRKKRDEIVDEYWIRNIALPICVKPLIEFIDKYSEKIKLLNESDKSDVSKYDHRLIEFQRNFKDDKDFIIMKFYVLSEKWNDIFSILSERLDTLDDAVTMHCYINQSISKSDNRQIEKYSIKEDVFYTILGETLADLSNLHVTEL